MKTTALIALTTAALCLPVLAGADEEARLQQARDKEMKRAMESAEYAAVDKRFEEKYGWAKEDFPDHHRKLVEKRRDAERAWKEAAGRMGRARDYDEIQTCKIPAYQASAMAHLAEMELKAASAERNWLRSAEKSGSETARKAARALVDNEKQTFEATREKYIRENKLRELAKQRSELEAILEEEYDKTKRREEDKRRKPDERREREEKRPEPEKPSPPKIRIE